jgi:hypothetical protein
MMKTTQTMLVAALLLCAAAPVLGQRPLEHTESLEILARLTSAKPETWLAAGTIEATHREYRAPKTTDQAKIDAAIQRATQAYQGGARRAVRSAKLAKLQLEALPFNVRYKMANEYTMRSNVLVRYDGERFYWSIDVVSRDDSVTPPSDLTGNYMTRNFRTGWHGHRIFSWNGREYTIYSASVKNAIVDASHRLPRAVNGPLTAGIVPWGRGPLSYENLRDADISTTEVSRDGTDLVEMAIELTNGSSMKLVLDPAKDYAVTSCTQPGPDDTIISSTYSAYEHLAGKWIPTTILIERYNVQTGELLASDKWDFLTVDAAVPGPEQFNVEYDADTVVEYYSPLSTKSAIFHYSNMADTHRLLAEHLTYAATSGRQTQNCATVAVKYTAARLGRSASDEVLARIVGDAGQTTLSDLQQSARQLGLHCRAIRADVATLKNLDDCQAILHIPGQEHFVVLDHVDEKYVWLADLSNSTFLYPQEATALARNWSAGTALLLSNHPITGSFHDIDDTALGAIAGGNGWSCTELLQEHDVDTCWETLYDCGGWFQYFYERWGCEPAASGTCSSGLLPSVSEVQCGWHPVYECQPIGDWYTYQMPACD